MKKIIMFLSFVLAVMMTQAQTSVTNLSNFQDTITNTGTVSPGVNMVNSYEQASFQVVVTKISGTVAGTGLLQASLDGTNYVDISTDTLTLTNQTTNTKLWNAGAVKYKYYRVKVTGSGTMSAHVKGYWIGRGKNN